MLEEGRPLQAGEAMAKTLETVGMVAARLRCLGIILEGNFRRSRSATAYGQCLLTVGFQCLDVAVSARSDVDLTG